MEKVKEFFSSPKKTAILGLIGVFITMLYILFGLQRNIKFIWCNYYG